MTLYQIDKVEMEIINNCFKDIIQFIMADYWGKLLTIEIRNNNIEAVKELIKTGANVNAIGKYGQTAIVEASCLGNLNIVNELIRAGANVNAVNKYGHSTALIEASCYGHIEIIKKLIDAGANTNAVNEWGFTPMIYASKYNRPKIIKILKEQNVNNIIKSKCLLLPHDIVYKIFMEML